MTSTIQIQSSQDLRPTQNPIHFWFGLSYANYLVMPRALLQSMPDEWQGRFVSLLQDFEAAYHHLEHPEGYQVLVVDNQRRYSVDPNPHYERGRTYIPPDWQAVVNDRASRAESGTDGFYDPNLEPGR